MSFFQGSSNFSIHESHLSIVQGSQYNRVQIIHNKGKKKQTIWDDYERVRTGDVYLTKVIGTGMIYGRSWRTMNASSTISIARVRGEDKEAEFLHVGYSGPKAFEAFKQDFDRFSAVKHPNIYQLFGYNDRRGLPSLIFYDALIPVERVPFINGKLSPILTVYLEFQLYATQPFKDEIAFVTSSAWIDPRSGALRKGPDIQSSKQLPLPRLTTKSTTSSLAPLSIQTYSDTSAVVDYVSRILPADAILWGVSSYGMICEAEMSAVQAWPYLAGSLWKRDQKDIIVRWTGLTETPRYVCVDRWWLKDERKTVMEDGSVRIKFTDPTDFKDEWYLEYVLFYGNKELAIKASWLAQAHSVFTRLGIHKDEWEEYCILGHFDFKFYRTKENAYEQRNTDATLDKSTGYLFIRPVPRLSDDETIWMSWAESAKYFWSFDPSGQEEMSESTRKSLGLPSFTTGTLLVGRYWDLDIYNTVEQLQISKNLDPKTTELARSLGYPLMQVVRDDNRLQELEDLASSTTIADILEFYNALNADNCCTSNEGSESDEEIVLYPRSNGAAVVE
ncbi:hypothetical protein Moror_9366 [Moniliophthora roreri MCA 2997]|uniref:Protein kinase domain-containing protein n=1 Tax=Moniliophthora roreri (strain MCA 2997) TaxID=1381753 RepID=V2WGU0_MONRO|nr:hypothetical protein Moror_9366 [Moniliophthora roreri MCA 2997]